MFFAEYTTEGIFCKALIGFEPMTVRLEGGCSVHLSYRANKKGRFASGPVLSLYV